jgi:parvulin-like peptidyl-prolyl isomerase
VGDPKIEQVVFGLSEGEISPIVRVGNQYAIFRCEAHVPARRVPMAQVRATLEEQIRDEKLRNEAHEIFGQLQAGAVVKNIINDPVARQQMPGVAATVNDRKVTIRELAEECIARHGEAVLETVINHRLLEQALRESRLEVTQADLDAEIAHAAKLSGVVDAQGAADIERWIEMVTTEEDVTKELYIRDAVWPSAALKKLTVDGVQVTQEDIQKGFDANYGPRVRCRAIVSDTQRHAQEAWDHARQALRQASDVAQKAEIFGRVAAEYSVEPSSKALEGKVPPIRKHGGQPALEREAFALKPGDMSGVIQVADKFVVLYCEGLTEPVTVDLQEVQQLIYDDVYEKKVRMAMSDRFEKLKADANIENHLAAVNQLPAAQAAASRTAAAAATAARPGNGPRR